MEQAAGVRPVIFLAPNLSIGETTLRALEHEGYRYDSSVPARRFDMGFDRLHYLKYFWAPRDPYRPSEDDLTTSGGSPLIEVPPSSCLFPINRTTLRMLGLPMVQRMIRWIGRRSRHLVFYCHPSEFVYAKDQVFPDAMSKWNQKGMCPANLFLVEYLTDHVLERGYAPTHMMEASAHQLDLRPRMGLRAGSFHSNRAYPKEGQG